MRKHLLVGASALALIAAGFELHAQITNIVANSLSGNECWQTTEFSAGQGFGAGPGIYVCSQTMHNTVGTTVNSLVGAGTISATVLNSNYILTGAATTVTFNTPSSPVPDGFILEITNGTTSAFAGTITVTPQGSQTLVPTSGAITNLASGGSREWRYNLANNVWYGMR